MAAASDLCGTRGEDGHGCVLVVEDDPLQRRVLLRLLRGWGYGTIEAADGGAAADRFREAIEQLDLVLLDIMLPVRNGIEVAREVRADRPELPIVACSAAFNAAVEADLRRVGVREYLPKPYIADVLRATLARLIPDAAENPNG